MMILHAATSTRKAVRGDHERSVGMTAPVVSVRVGAPMCRARTTPAETVGGDERADVAGENQRRETDGFEVLPEP